VVAVADRTGDLDGSCSRLDRPGGGADRVDLGVISRGGRDARGGGCHGPVFLCVMRMPGLDVIGRAWRLRWSAVRLTPLWVKNGTPLGQSRCEVWSKFSFCDTLPDMTILEVPPVTDADEADALTIGRRIRQLRTARRMTLDELAAAVERAPSQL